MKKLEKSFTGIGEVRGFAFEQVLESQKAYLYKVNGDRYEVFLKKEQKAGEAIISGQKVIFEEKELYPRSEEFGKIAWAFQDYDKALVRFNLITNQ